MVHVAEAANVSIFTVSAVVNGTRPVSDELRARTEQAIKDTGYKRNGIARSLKTGKTKTVGVSVGDITNPFYTDVVSIIQQVLHKAGYAVMLCCNDRSVTLQEEQILLMRDRMVDGLIISPTGDDEQLRTVLSNTDVPVVLIDRLLDGVDCDVVVLDNKPAVAEAIRYLIGLGHRRIAFVSGMHDTFPGRARLAGYHAALEDAGIAKDDSLVELGNFRLEGAYVATKRLLTGRAKPTAIFGVNNEALIGIMKALRDLGLSCPEDVSVAALDDFPWADSFQPTLTTVAQPLREIGEQSAKLLLDRLTGKCDAASRSVVLQGRLIVRGSCRALTG
jgi:LacI family transcriptional regulator